MGSGFAWERALALLEHSLTGPVTMSLGIVAVCLLGLTFAYAEHGIFRRVVGVVFGLSVAFTAAGLVVLLFT